MKLAKKKSHLKLKIASPRDKLLPILIQSSHLSISLLQPLSYSILLKQHSPFTFRSALLLCRMGKREREIVLCPLSSPSFILGCLGSGTGTVPPHPSWMGRCCAGPRAAIIQRRSRRIGT